MMEISIYNASCKTYAIMAADFYRSYLEATDFLSQPLPDDEKIDWDKHFYDFVYNFRLQERSAISAIIFQALAIEAYINLFGAYFLTDEVFYEKYEPEKSSKKKVRYLSTTKKLQSICQGRYPQKHLTEIEELFRKRDRLVHTKPKRINISADNLSALLKEHHESQKDFDFVFENIDRQMSLYVELQNNITKILGTGRELIDEIESNTWGEIQDILDKEFSQ